MVVDDDDAIREIVEIVVEAEGYPVVTAANGREALDRLRSGLRPGMILLDLRMPDMDGRTFRELQRREPPLAGIPVVILSGDLDACRAAAGLGTDYILKPIDLEQLLSLVRRFCRPAPPGSPAALVPSSTGHDAPTSTERPSHESIHTTVTKH